MKDFIIMTDSCCDLPIDYIDKKKIAFVSLPYILGGKEYLDDFGKSLSVKDFYTEMRKSEIPKTSQPNPEAFFKVFKEIISQHKSALYIGVSSGLSGTYNSANIAKNMILDENKDAQIVNVDVLTASLGQGLMVMKAVEMQENGSTIEQIVSFIEMTKLNLNTYITVDDLNHLKRGGRISSVAAVFGIMLHIKPVLTLNDEGKVISILKVKGRKNVINKLAEIVVGKIENPENQTMAICHGDVEAEALKLKELILKQVKVKDILINVVGPVVGTFGGPGSLTVFFIGKHRQNHIIDVEI